MKRSEEARGPVDRLLVALVSGAVVVGAVAMAASAATLAELGHAVGWVQAWGRVRMSWSLPIAVDALALVAGAVWLASRMSEQARSLARWITLAAVLGSVGLNAIGHLVQSGDIVVGAKLRIGVSTVPPLVAAVVVHLVGVVLTTRREAAEPAEPAETTPAPRRAAQGQADGTTAPGTPAPRPRPAAPTAPVTVPSPAPALPAAPERVSAAVAPVAQPRPQAPAPADPVRVPAADPAPVPASVPAAPVPVPAPARESAPATVQAPERSSEAVSAPAETAGPVPAREGASGAVAASAPARAQVSARIPAAGPRTVE
ncbi:DUF2637 domain-containing protein, partial [Streptomyces sp. NPDC001750]|uniref:DUF2637 domain-containing protein n=1 Tax=Streptomyces sp. NPDC001750 TaxID=3364607 RepID=UPI0036A26DE4